MAVLLDYALTDVASVKETLGIDAGDTSKDNLIIRKINLATEIIEGYTGRRFKSTTYENEEYDATGIDALVLKQRPVTALASIGVRSTTLNQSDWDTIDAENYFLDANAGVVEGISNFYGRWNRYRVSYTAGYTTIPADIAEAATTLAAFYVDSNTSSTGTNVKRKSEGQRSIEYYDAPAGSGNTGVIEQLGLDEILDRYVNYPLTAI